VLSLPGKQQGRRASAQGRPVRPPDRCPAVLLRQLQTYRQNHKQAVLGPKKHLIRKKHEKSEKFGKNIEKTPKIAKNLKKI
jgi:hypothetical protein